MFLLVALAARLADLLVIAETVAVLVLHVAVIRFVFTVWTDAGRTVPGARVHVGVAVVAVVAGGQGHRTVRDPAAVIGVVAVPVGVPGVIDALPVTAIRHGALRRVRGWRGTICRLRAARNAHVRERWSVIRLRRNDLCVLRRAGVRDAGKRLFVVAATRRRGDDGDDGNEEAK